KLVFKLGAATLLSANAILMQIKLMPLLGRRRPLAANLSPIELAMVVAIGSLSAACWASITAVAFLKPLHALQASELYAGLLAMFIAIACALSVLIAFGRWQSAGNAGDDHVATHDAGDTNNTPAGARIYWLRDAKGATGGAWRRTRSAPRTEASREPATGDAGQQTSFAEAAASCRRALIGAASVSLFANLLMLTGPIFMLQVYDRVLTSKSLPTLTALFGLAVGLFAFMGLLDLLRSRLLVRIGLRLDRMLSRQVFARTLDVGDAASVARSHQLCRDVQQVRQFVSGAGATALFDMPWAPIYFALVCLFHWLLGVVALVGAAVLVVLSLLNEVLARKPVKEATLHAAECDRMLEAGRRNAETLQAMGMADRFNDRMIRLHSTEAMVQTKAADVGGLLLVLSKLTRLILQAAMLAAGAYLVLANQASPGVMIAASIIMSRALAPIEQAISHWRGFVAARHGLRRLSAEIDGCDRDTGKMAMPEPQGRIAVENLFAAPPGQREPTLKGLSFRLEPGDAMGVLGPSGAGKSTLARVLVGAWTPLRGRVLIDGAPMDQWPRNQLGCNIGYLPQNAELFEGTVAENIGRFRTDVHPDEIYAAAEAADVHRMILRLPDGYATKVGDGGVSLSGGQRQRIALARALFGRPALVVLDEPNSNLDAEGEAALAHAIRSMREAGKCVVVMAHRHKALENANLLLVLKEGRQAAFGGKDEIMKRASAARRRKETAAHA
ncbi:MAG: hypothetical protein RLZ98_3026, partial [Pseudomonadota bacterium]